MKSVFHFLTRMHRFARQNTFYPLMLLTLFAFGLWVSRVKFSDDFRYYFLFWNLFLAWVPYGFAIAALFAEKLLPKPWHWLLIVPLLVGWLLFLPNAPYLVTDMIHFRAVDPVPYWYDIGLFIILAWTGCLLAIVSLNIVQDLAYRHFGTLISWLVSLTSIALCGLGLYLGRVLRWNSWDALYSVDTILLDLVRTFVFSPLSNLYAVGFTLMFTAMVGMFYFTIRSIDSRQQGLSGLEDTLPTRVG